MAETLHDNTKSTHCHDVGASSLEPSLRQCNVVTKRIWSVLGHFVNWTVTQLAQGIEMINHIYCCQIIAANSVVLRVSYIAVDSSDRLFHDLSRNHAGCQRVQNYVRNQLRRGTDKKQADLSCQNNGSNIMYFLIRVVMLLTKTEILIQYRTEPKRKYMCF